MSIPYSGGFSRSAGIYSAIGKHFKLVNLKPVKQIVFKFDPFQPNVKTVRDCLFLFSSERVAFSNPRCLIKSEVQDNVEPTIAVTLEEGKKLLFKTENLNTLEFLVEFNKIVLPLVPKEDEIVGKVAGKIAAGSKAGGQKPGSKQISKKK